MNKILTYNELQIVYLALATAVLPFVAFIINFFIKSKTSKIAGWISVAAIAASAVTATVVFKNIWQGPIIQTHQLWFTIGTTNVYAGVMLNNLSALMLLIITLVALTIY